MKTRVTIMSFDLDKSIATWRRRYEHDRAFLEEDVRELERHVRDNVGALVAEGWTEEEAFLEVIREMGEHEEVRGAYRNVLWGKLKREHTITDHLSSAATMLKNYLTIALRNLRRHPGYTLINIAGLAVGIACCLFILLLVRDELSYDSFHERAERIFRVTSVFSAGEEAVVTPTVLAPTFRREFPEVEEAVRLYPIGSFRPIVVRYGDRMFQEIGFVYADSTVFDVFTLPLFEGDPASALARPNTLVLSESAARKYFGDENPLGETLIVDSDEEYEVTGVMEDLPSQSHLHFDFLASFSSTKWAPQETWWSANFLTYVLLRDRDDVAALRRHIGDLVTRVKAQQPDLLSNEYALRLQSLTDIRLYHEGRITYVYLFSAIAFFIMLLACINYLNLATARSMRRAREVGVRKVLGAHRRQLAGQFYFESFVLTTTGLVLSLPLIWLFLPAFNSISGKQFGLDALWQPFILATLAGLGLIVGVLAGSYPALLLSAIQPARVLKSSRSIMTSGIRLRQVLVTFQFAVSVALIAASGVVYFQLDYVRSRNLGFGKDQVVVLPTGPEQYTALKTTLLQHAHVLNVSAVNSIPGYQKGGYRLYAEGLKLPEGEYFSILGVPADRDVVETLDLELIAGPGFPKSDAYAPDSGSYAYLVNEATLRTLGWSAEQAIGRRMGVSENRMGEVVGVVRDYHYASLHETIEPLALFIEGDSYEYLMVKIAPTDVPGTLNFLRQTWSSLVPHRPFEYTFLDQQFDALYRADEQAGQIFGAFAALAILIACLGLFGLAAFSAEQRTKEIGIRKVLGATIPSIIVLLSKEFAKLVLLGFIVAVPVAWFAMERWLEDFAYRIELGPGVFLLAGGMALAIALLTVSYQAIKAAMADPVKSLRYE